MARDLKPERAIVPIVRYAPDRIISEVLGTGFFVGDGTVKHLVTARHVIQNAPLAEGEKYALLLTEDKGVALIAISQIRAAADFDVTVCSVEQSLLGSAVPLALATSDPALNEDVSSFEYSSTRFDRTDMGYHVSFEPYAHKGNVVRSYVSTFPEAIKTPCLLTSYPALQGASGAPVIATIKAPKQFAVGGMLVANAERHLIPAQIVTIHDGPSYKESTSYFLAFGKAVSWAVLAQCLEGMNVPFARASRAAR